MNDLNMVRISTFLLLALSLSACYKSQNDVTIEGYAPIYGNTAEIHKIYSDLTPTQITNGGKILRSGSRIYVVESGLGIHILKYLPSEGPIHEAFIHVMGCNDIALKDGYLYANNLDDLVVIEIKDVLNPRVVNRTPDVFSGATLIDLPPMRGTYYECPRDNDSTLIGWELKVLKNPKCFYE